MLWQIDIHPGAGEIDREGQRIADDAAELGVARHLKVRAIHGFLLEGNFQDASDVERVVGELLSDRVVQRAIISHVGDPQLLVPPADHPHVMHVLFKPGVMDPEAQSAQDALADQGFPRSVVRRFRKFWLGGVDADQLPVLGRRQLANDSIEQFVIGPLAVDHLSLGSPYNFRLHHVELSRLNDAELTELSRTGQLYLTLVEMQTIQRYFQELGREPTDIELETVAQTWSEHCSHKTLAGRIAYRDDQGERRFGNMLKETIFAATQQIRRQLGNDDWCVSVFEDNAGIVRFDDDYNVVFKVETHNHPSALEPYGGANTGLGGVIRDPLGTGLGAKPVCNTDVFCFAPPNTPGDSLPPGVLHPRRVMKGVVSGVRDYGNRMGIPTVNGAVYFDRRYLGNPLVFCGNVGLIPRDKCRKAPQQGDYIVALGGRTGRDGIHGATFSSAELTSESESISGGAVQIGNAITEKMLMDVLLEARDRGLYHAVTDCGAGGFSSAVGEMGEHIGAEVWLERVPLKYDGLSYTEIWISEAQERMVLAVSPEHWDEFNSLCSSEQVEATVIGQFVPTGRLQLKYDENLVGDLSMEFLHDGRPPVVRDAVYQPAPAAAWTGPTQASHDHATELMSLLSSLNIASKHWIIRQYDHEVQGTSVIKPLVGIQEDGPSDAAVIRPRLDSRRGLVIACGMNPYFGDFDPYAMATSGIDEAVRNCVAVGADPERVAILDNFCWGYTDRPETLGSLVRAALGCHDLAVAWGCPFISGKDSLNNEFSYVDSNGQKQTIRIPSTLLISALGQVDDVGRCITMDFKRPGNAVYVVGTTYAELGGSHFGLIHGASGGQVPVVRAATAQQTFRHLHSAIVGGLVRSCHDPSEGGLAVALAEMAFAGGLGAQIDLTSAPLDLAGDSAAPELLLLFAESNSRFVCEVPADRTAQFEQAMNGTAFARIGQLTDSRSLTISYAGRTLIDASLSALKQSWQQPLDW